MNVESSIRAMMAILFRLDEAAIPADASMDTIAQWDSLAHLDLLTAIEEEFHPGFTVWDFDNLRSLADIVRRVEGKH